MKLLKNNLFILFASLSLATCNVQGMNFGSIVSKVCTGIQATCAVGSFWAATAFGYYDGNERMKRLADAPLHTAQFYRDIFKEKGVKKPEKIINELSSQQAARYLLFNRLPIMSIDLNLLVPVCV